MVRDYQTMSTVSLVVASLVMDQMMNRLQMAILLMFIIARMPDYGMFIPRIYASAAKSCLYAFASMMIISLVRALQILRTKDTLNTPEDARFIPMLFPGQTTHRRFFPKKHHFSYSYLMVGVPVPWQGSVGSMLSVDTESISSSWWSYFSLYSTRKKDAWFTVNADDYMSRRAIKGGLRAKLDEYLIEQVRISPSEVSY